MPRTGPRVRVSGCWRHRRLSLSRLACVATSGTRRRILWKRSFHATREPPPPRRSGRRGHRECVEGFADRSDAKPSSDADTRLSLANASNRNPQQRRHRNLSFSVEQRHRSKPKKQTHLFHPAADEPTGDSFFLRLSVLSRPRENRERWGEEGDCSNMSGERAAPLAACYSFGVVF